MVWAEIITNTIWGVISWLYLNAIIPPRYDDVRSHPYDD